MKIVKPSDNHCADGAGADFNAQVWPCFDGLCDDEHDGNDYVASGYVSFGDAAADLAATIATIPQGITLTIGGGPGSELITSLTVGAARGDDDDDPYDLGNGSDKPKTEPADYSWAAMPPPAAEDAPAAKPAAPATIADEWASMKRPLSEWGMRYMVNRVDCRGGYWKKDGVVKPTTRKDRSVYPDVKRDDGPLTSVVIERHFDPPHGEELGSIVGYHSISREDTCKWACIELDAHGGEAHEREANTTAALAWYKKLTEDGYTCRLWDSDGKGGYHLDILLLPSPSHDVYFFGRAMVADHRDYGLANPPEVFPKRQTHNTKAGFGGGWVREIGRHHKRDHYSKVWNGSEWLEGREAAEHVISLRPTDNPVPKAPAPTPKELERLVLEEEESRPKRAGTKAGTFIMSNAREIREALRTIPERQLLSEAGYLPGSQESHMRHPNADSCDSVSLMNDDVSYHHGTNDPARGKGCRGDGNTFNQWLVLKNIIHNGNYDAAIRDAARRVNIEYREWEVETNEKTISDVAVMVEESEPQIVRED